MKKLVFIDNDNIDHAKDGSNKAKNILEDFFGIPRNVVELMTLVPDFRDLTSEQKYGIVFNRSNAIVTWSMYTSTHYNSFGQAYSLFAGAARNEIKGLIYIDGSGELCNALDRMLRDRTEMLDIVCAIETNYILSFEYKTNKAFRIRVDFTNGRHGKLYREEEINLMGLLIG